MREGLLLRREMGSVLFVLIIAQCGPQLPGHVPRHQRTVRPTAPLACASIAVPSFAVLKGVVVSFLCRS